MREVIIIETAFWEARMVALMVGVALSLCFAIALAVSGMEGAKEFPLLDVKFRPRARALDLEVIDKDGDGAYYRVPIDNVAVIGKVAWEHTAVMLDGLSGGRCKRALIISNRDHEAWLRKIKEYQDRAKAEPLRRRAIAPPN